MAIYHINKTYSAANNIATGASATTFFGPIPITHMENISFVIQSCAADTIQLTLRGLIDQGGAFGGPLPAGMFQNSDLALVSGGTHINALVGINSFNYLVITGSATANISASDVLLRLTGKARN